MISSFSLVILTTLTLQVRYFFDKILVADDRVSESYVLSHSKHYHKNNKHKDSHNNDNCKHRKYPAQRTKVCRVGLEYLYVVFYIEDLFYAVPQTLEDPPKACKH